MKYKFIKNVKYGATYYQEGDEIELDEVAAEGLKGLVESIEKIEEPEASEEVPVEEPKKRGRKKKK